MESNETLETENKHLKQKIEEYQSFFMFNLYIYSKRSKEKWVEKWFFRITIKVYRKWKIKRKSRAKFFVFYATRKKLTGVKQLENLLKAKKSEIVDLFEANKNLEEQIQDYKSKLEHSINKVTEEKLPDSFLKQENEQFSSIIKMTALFNN